MSLERTITVDYSGPAYEHVYDSHLKLFELLAKSTQPFKVLQARSCWGPLLWYLGHEVDDVKPCPSCSGIDWREVWNASNDVRHTVEMAATCRPELVHALYLIDTRWPQRRLNQHLDEFVVTSNGSFFRPEVQEFMELLDNYTPAKPNCIIVPCAADKPYPAPLHQAVKGIVDDSYEIIIATGVLGLIPEALWYAAPNYDSGIPHFYRVEQCVARYFARWRFSRIVGYLDFYAHWVKRGLQQIGLEATFIFGSHYRDEYENLLDPACLAMLKATMGR